ncbi:NAD(P)-dependent oxidoreductase [Halobellus clavatus]|uniref:D-3-phosphoglycerate dehydrogenase n=1 Tax=Halobellus clavatus TaxID=660517 RepID=A0A1H3FW83_9EURY|nr:2-hydroxyacid dehydrogenase [Halobellus clavatus]SDX95085.1 D-3-phosphoglycerate dehydrogenase [Halobellus clavatus]
MTRAIVDQDITPTDRLLNGLPDDWDVTVGLDSEEATLRTELPSYDVALVTSRVPLTRAVLERATDLDLIGKLGTGIDSIDLDAAREQGITVTHTPGHNALSVAEHALGLTLATARRLPTAGELIAEGRWRDEYPLGRRISGSTVGIVGFGNVGKRVGMLFSGFDVDRLVADPYVPSIDAELAHGRQTDLETLLESSDVVILTPELTDETRGLIGATELDRMREDALLVNVSRGPVVEQAALVDAIESGTIGGAGLDVFESEPVPADSSLQDLDNVVLTPHIAAMTSECRAGNIDQLAANVTRLFDGESILERYVAVEARS